MDATDDYFIMLQNTCRVCLKNKTSMISLFDVHILEKTVAGLFRYCTGLDVKKEDNFPKNLCTDCFEKLQDAHQIKKTSIESHFMLKGLFEKHRQSAKKKEVQLEYRVIEISHEAIDIPSTSRQSTDSQMNVKEEPEEFEYEDYVEETENPLEEIDEEEPIDEMIEIQSKQRKQKAVVHPPFYCDTCQTEVFTGKAYHLQEHKKNGTEPIENCPTCKRMFYVHSDYVNHACDTTVKTCQPCQITFPGTGDFQKHLGESHFEGGIFKCTEIGCLEQETSLRDAYYHIKWHKNPVDQICEMCGMQFKNSHKFSRHTSNHRKGSVRATCDRCGVTINGKMNLTRHMKSKHLNFKYYCESCPKMYSNSMILKAHKIKEHGLESPHSCQQCGEPFLFLSQLNLHHEKFCKHINLLTYGAIHKPRAQRRPKEEIEKIYKCPNCSQFFNHRSNLSRHNKQVHLKLKPWTCSVCSKSFGQKTELATHTRIHTGEKPYQCKWCGVKYSDRSTLYKHVKNHHKDV